MGEPGDGPSNTGARRVPTPAGLAAAGLVLLLALPVLPAGVGEGGSTNRLSAQEPLVETGPPPLQVREAIVDFLNDPGVLLMDGGGRVPAGRTVDGDLAVLEGSLDLAGTVVGDVVVVNGDLRLGSEAVVEGAAIVVGGGVEGFTVADVQGPLTVYAQRLRYAVESGRVTLLGPAERDDDGFSPSLGFGRSRLTIRAGTNYNRVEGLPVMFGPIVETASTNPFRLEALAVWRTDNGFTLDPSELGYRVRAEQFLGGRELFSVGAAAHSLVTPVEQWALTDLEGSLATFLFHRDYRDYFERTGWSAFARFRSPTLPLGFALEYRDEDHSFSPVGSPWALKDNEKAWRPQPLVAAGRLRSLRGTLTFDTRNDVEEPTHGWWIRARSELGVDGDLAYPAHVVPYAPGTIDDPPGIVPVAPEPVDATFASGFVDARRYNRVGPTTELVLRAVVGGSLTGDPLPSQLQHTLGGEGSLPGFPLFSVDCGARSVAGGVTVTGASIRKEVFPRYGCDRVALFQADLRGDLGWSVDVGDLFDEPDPDALASGTEIRPRWTAFLDAGRGWSMDEGTPPILRHDEETRLDLGLGLLVRGIGVYWAFPVSGPSHDPNFFVRLDHRF